MSDDDFDINRYKGLEPVPMMLAMRRDLEFKMPPKGVSTTTARFGGYIWERMTWRCEAEGCWYITTPSSDANLVQLQEYHLRPGIDQCPTPPRRERLPSGKEELEKLWLEIDDVVDAIKSEQPYRGMNAAGLNGYVKGLAFSVVMKDTEFYQDIKAVATEAMRRWKMRQGQIPWAPTPTHFTHAHKWFPTGGWKQTKKDEPAITKSAATVKPAPRKAVPTKSALSKQGRKFSAAEVSVIKSGHASGALTEEDLAGMYGCSVAEINAALAG